MLLTLDWQARRRHRLTMRCDWNWLRQMDRSSRSSLFHQAAIITPLSLGGW